MSDTFIFPQRTIHLDFHNGPQVPDVGRDFNPQQFAQTFKDACVDSVTVFAKCHHGHLYYNTAHPARHPSLPQDLDLLGEQVKALHSAGIRAPTTGVLVGGGNWAETGAAAVSKLAVTARHLKSMVFIFGRMAGKVYSLRPKKRRNLQHGSRV